VAVGRRHLDVVVSETAVLALLARSRGGGLEAARALLLLVIVLAGLLFQGAVEGIKLVLDLGGGERTQLALLLLEPLDQELPDLFLGLALFLGLHRTLLRLAGTAHVLKVLDV
jgi:hypothetical protein